MNVNFSDLPLARVNSRYGERKFPLHILTNLSGHSREISKNYYNDGKRPNAPSYTTLQYTIGGRGRIEKDGKGRDVPPGFMMILNVPGEEAYYLPENSDYWEFVFLTLVGRDSYRVVKAVQSSLGSVIPAEKIPKSMELFGGLIRDLFSRKITGAFDNSSRTYRLCMTLLEESGEVEAEKKIASFEELLVMLHNNMHRDIPVDEMAGLMRLSRSHFTRLFTDHVGMSPRKYLEDLRLKTAVSLLQSETLNIKEAAGLVGIRDENYFCRIFKNRYGISPGKFRNKIYWER